MKVKRFLAPDMRRAIQQVRSEHGPDAIILSSASVDGGVEIISAVDYDEALLARLGTGRDEPAAQRQAVGGSSESAQSDDVHAAWREEDGFQDRTLQLLRAEMDTVKRMLREQYNHLSLADLKSFHPDRALLLRRVSALGLAPALGDLLVREVVHPEQSDRAWREIVLGIAKRLVVVEEDPIASGGVIAMVGPTGVGKTTTIAKLAARHCLQHGAESMALVTTDTFRIGAQRHLEAFGAILNVPVRRAGTTEELRRLLQELAAKRLVLVDTAGMAPRDCRIAESLQRLKACPPLRHYLVLAANMQTAAMHDAVRAFGGDGLAGVALTKLDETRTLGAALSLLIESRLPAVWMSSGQRVPEDLSLARVIHLVRWLLEWTPGGMEGQVANMARPTAAAQGEVADV